MHIFTAAPSGGFGGAGHVFLLRTFSAAAAGLSFGLLMEWRGNLLGPIVGHFLVNLVNLRHLARSRQSD